MTLKTAYILDTKKYNELYGIQKEDTGNRREAHTANSAVLPDTSDNVPPTVSSTDSISDEGRKVKKKLSVDTHIPEQLKIMR